MAYTLYCSMVALYSKRAEKELSTRSMRALTIRRLWVVFSTALSSSALRAHLSTRDGLYSLPARHACYLAAHNSRRALHRTSDIGSSAPDAPLHARVHALDSLIVL